jgi:hypothetical protein
MELHHLASRQDVEICIKKIKSFGWLYSKVLFSNLIHSFQNFLGKEKADALSIEKAHFLVLLYNGYLDYCPREGGT